MPIVIVFVLGLVCGLVTFWRGFHGAIALPMAATAATAIWVGGCYLLFAFTAPSELGAPLPAAIIQTFVTGLAGATGALLFHRIPAIKQGQ